MTCRRREGGFHGGALRSLLLRDSCMGYLKKYNYAHMSAGIYKREWLEFTFESYTPLGLILPKAGFGCVTCLAHHVIAQLAEMKSLIGCYTHS